MSELNQTFASDPFFKRYSVTLSYSLLHEVLKNLARKLCLPHIVNATQTSNHSRMRSVFLDDMMNQVPMLNGSNGETTLHQSLKHGCVRVALDRDS